MSRRVLAWQCEYCGELKKTQKICERHERACRKNPNGHNCIDCVHSAIIGDSWECTLRGVLCSRAISGNCELYEKCV